MNLTYEEIEAIRVVLRTLPDCYYRDVLVRLLARIADARMCDTN